VHLLEIRGTIVKRETDWSFVGCGIVYILFILAAALLFICHCKEIEGGGSTVDTLYVSSTDTIYSIDTLFIYSEVFHKDTVWWKEEAEFVSYDSTLGVERRAVYKSTYTVRWTHPFTDITGGQEEEVWFEVAADIFTDRDNLIKWTPTRQRWYGRHYGATLLEEYKARRNLWEYIISGIEIGEYVVPSVRAVDRAGQVSTWMRATDSMLVEHPFYIVREK